MPDDKKQVSKAPPPIRPLTGGGGYILPRQPTTPKALDWDFWRHMPHVHLWQACALSLNINPDSMQRISDGWMAGPGSGPKFQSSSFPSKEVEERFNKRLRLLAKFITYPDHFRLHVAAALKLITFPTMRRSRIDHHICSRKAASPGKA
ncbi:MAG: hypothetical protein SGJ20_10600, partial [Planctomycetota bacterium]|nr:hypothetical protein [Planctomycetota bacterium]